MIEPRGARSVGDGDRGNGAPITLLGVVTACFRVDRLLRIGRGRGEVVETLQVRLEPGEVDLDVRGGELLLESRASATEVTSVNTLSAWAA